VIARQSIDQLLEVAPIEDVVGQYLTLRKRGVNLIGLCPFHDEKTPSFNVNPVRGIYKCFGCGKGGNAIQFVMDVENLSFVEAVKQLASRFSLELIETGPAEGQDEQLEQAQRQDLYAALGFAGEYFSQCLFDTEPGKDIALEYFRERGFTIETIRKWGLGFALDEWSGLLQAAEKAGFKKEILELASLVKKSESGKSFDMFRNRVMFPIWSVSGKIVAFAGRLMGKAEGQPKYINSAESPVYHKSDHLFGLFQARNSVKKLDKVYLTEGYTDVITLWQGGIENVVASSGTALTENQIRLIRRFTGNVTVLYDGDQAGLKASLRGIDLLLKEGLNVRVVLFPDGEDPDSYCRKQGGEAFARFLDVNEKNFILFKAELLFGEAGNDPIRKAEAIRDILNSLALIRDAIKRVELVKELATLAGQSAEHLLHELNKLVLSQWQKQGEEIRSEIGRIAEQSPVEAPVATFDDIHQERGLLALVIQHGNAVLPDEPRALWSIVLEELKANEGNFTFSDPLTARTFERLKMMHEAEQAPDPHFFIRSEDPELASFAADVLSAEVYTLSPAWAKNDIVVPQLEENLHKLMAGTFNHLWRKKMELMIMSKQEALKETMESEELDDLLNFIKYLQTKRKEYADAFGTVVPRI